MVIKILIVEDDELISNLIKLNLSIAKYQSRQVYDGEEALKLIKEEKFDLILLDIMLPQIDGFTIFEKIKKMSIPTIFLTAKTSVTDKVYGLKLGADDYITKPFEGIELLARIENALRHYNKESKIIFYKNLQINIDGRIVKLNEKDVELTSKEFDLFLFLVENKNSVLTREKLLENVWGYDYYGETRTVDNHIQRIRKKLDLKNEIKTIFGLGYRLEW